MWDQFRQRADAFDGAFAWTIQTLDLSQAGEMQRVEVLFASGDFFSMFGVRAIVGRTFTAADDVRGGGPDGAVVVISQVRQARGPRKRCGRREVRRLREWWWTAGGSNSRPPRCERGALPTELAAHSTRVRILNCTMDPS
jgi:hypothetical protein